MKMKNNKKINKLNHIQSFNTKDTTMKKLTLLLALLVVGFSANTFAANPQASATATATAVIVTPIGISKTVDLNFGNIVASTAGGTLAVSTVGGTTYTGVSAPSVPGTIAAAAFSVTGAANMTYAITLPNTITLSDGASHSMTVGSFVSNPSGTGTLSGTGAQTLNVGATLTVGASQVAGTYTNSTDLTVTVNYN